MADTKISALTAIAAVAGEDLIAVVDDPAGTPTTKKATITQLQTFLGALQNVVEDTTPQLGGQLDVNGQALGDGTLELLTFTETGSAVNQLNVTNAATGSGPTLSAAGDDTNIDLLLAGKGTGVVKANGNTVYTDEWYGIALSDETTTITTGTNKATMALPFAVTVLDVFASVNTVSSSGLPTVDINEGGTTILSTKLTIDANEKTSLTAATPAVISDSSIAAGAEIGFDIDTAGTGAKGLKVWIKVRRA